MSIQTHKWHPVFIFSIITSGIGLITALFTGLSHTGILIAVILFLAHIPGLWIARSTKATPPPSKKNPDSFAVRYILATYILSTGLGFLSWIIFFIPGSLVRDTLLQISPALGWAVVLAGFWLVFSSANLKDEGERRNVFLIGSVLLPVFGTVFFFWLSSQIFAFTVDDAYITFRYSRNLAAGWGPTYNPGQPPVEGYTTFAWMLLMTLPHFMKVNVATFSKVVGVALTSGTLALVSFLTYTLSKAYPTQARLFFGAFAAFLTGMLPITAIHAVSGMETSLFTFLITLLVTLVVVGIQNSSPLLYWSPVLALLIGLTRPEGNIIAGLLLFAGWVFSKAPRRLRVIKAGFWLYILPGGLYFIWRTLYYQLAFPLPFYMKVLHGSGLAGAGEVGAYLQYVLPAVSVLAAITLLRFRSEFLLVLLPVGFLLIFYLFPVHAMGFDWRFIYPVTPLIFVITAIGGLILFGLLSPQISKKIPWEFVLFLGLLLVSLGNLKNLDGMISTKQNYGAGINNYKFFGTVLSEYNHDHEFTLALGDAGTAPYYSDWLVIDLFGLNTREIAFQSVPVPTLLFEKQPTDLILLFVGGNRNRISDEHTGKQLLYEQAVQQGMARIATFPFGRSDFVWVLGYPDSDIADYIQQNLSINVE